MINISWNIIRVFWDIMGVVSISHMGTINIGTIVNMVTTINVGTSYMDTINM